MNLPVTPSRLPAEVDLAIIGAGIMGLGLADNLARLGFCDAVVLESGHLACGASGRNGGGVRQQWSTELNIHLMQESVELCRSFAREHGINIWMRQGGYLFLARDPKILERMESAVALQNRCGVPTRQITVGEAAELVPELDADQFSGACFNPTDAIVFPWPFLWGYARGASQRGISIHTRTPVTQIDILSDGGFALQTPRGTVKAKRIVNAAGAWSGSVAALAGQSLPTWPERHEILSTEAVKPFLRPMVSLLDTGLYFSQSLRGEVVGGISVPDSPTATVRLGSRLAFTRAMARGICALAPRLGLLKIVRQWAGPYDHSPDGDPLVGPLPSLPGFIVCCGFVGHGFMMGPVVTRHLAEYLVNGTRHPFFDAWDPGRFGKQGDVNRSTSEHMNIG